MKWLQRQRKTSTTAVSVSEGRGFHTFPGFTNSGSLPGILELSATVYLTNEWALAFDKQEEIFKQQALDKWQQPTWLLRTSLTGIGKITNSTMTVHYLSGHRMSWHFARCIISLFLFFYHTNQRVFPNNSKLGVALFFFLFKLGGFPEICLKGLIISLCIFNKWYAMYLC